jgi:peptidoglycan hydrolase CwlO-like protein
MASKTLIVGFIFILTFALQSAAAGEDPLTLEVRKLAAEIEESRDQLSSLDDELEHTTKEIIYIYQHLESSELALEQQRRALDSRIQEVYKNYNHMILSVFLDARGLGDVWKNFRFLAKINQSDRQLLAANQLRLTEVRRLRADLAKHKMSQVELKRRKREEYLVLQQTLLRKKALLEAKLGQAAVQP